MQTSHASSKPSGRSPSSAAELIAQKFPPVARYYPHLETLSAPQAAFLVLDGREAFYGGAAGGGKSDALLMAALQHVDKPGYNALLLRRTFPELEGADGLIAKAHEWFGAFRESKELHWNEQKHRWTFPSGATIQFGHVQDEAAIYRYQGQAYQFVGFDELTHFTERQYDYIAFTRARRVKAHELAGIPVRARAASNPGNVGHGWVKKRFITQPKPGVIFVPAKLADNPGLDVATYTEDLSHLPTELRRQLLDGDWDAFEGAAFPLFGELHLVDHFPLTDSFDRIEGMDYGLNGYAWYLLATDYDGNLIFADSVYGKDQLPDTVADEVVAKRKAGWGFGHTVHADPSLWHRTGRRNKFGQPAMLADEFSEAGVPIIKGNNDPRAGLIRLRKLMEPSPRRRFPSWHPRAGAHGAPGLFIVSPGCWQLVEQLAAAPLQPIDKPDGGEKIDPEWESKYGHGCAAARYTVMAKPGPSDEPESWENTPPHLREQWQDAEAIAAEARRTALDEYHARVETGSTRRRTQRV